MARFLNWLTGNPSRRLASKRTAGTPDRPAVKNSQRRARIRPAESGRQPEFVDLEPNMGGRVERSGSEKSAFVKSKYIREDSGTHETLTIVNDSIPPLADDNGIDPYNTGRFDPSRYWDKTRK